MSVIHLEEPTGHSVTIVTPDVEEQFSLEDWKSEMQALKEANIEGYVEALGGYCVAANNMYQAGMGMVDDEGFGLVETAREWGDVLNPMVTELVSEYPGLAPLFVKGVMASVNGMLYA